MHSTFGQRILIWGNSCAGKSTLAERIAEQLRVPFVDLDALNWLPNWQGLNDTDPARLEARMRKATEHDAWIVAGSYTEQAQRTFWPRLQTIIWLDLPMERLLYRVMIRSWQRWRSGELLWGTNYENFWDQLKLWNKDDSLIWWIVTNHYRKRRRTYEVVTDPRWAHIRFVRVATQSQASALLQEITVRTAIEGR